MSSQPDAAPRPRSHAGRYLFCVTETTDRKTLVAIVAEVNS